MPPRFLNRQRSVRLDTRGLRRALGEAMRHIGLAHAELSVLIAGPRTVRRLNRDYRGIDATTDVLSFAQIALPGAIPVDESGIARDEDGSYQLGDIAIDAARAAEQARQAGVNADDEVMRLLAHGLLHLAGHTHGDSASKRRMFREQEKLLMIMREAF